MSTLNFFKWEHVANQEILYHMNNNGLFVRRLCVELPFMKFRKEQKNYIYISEAAEASLKQYARQKLLFKFMNI